VPEASIAVVIPPAADWMESPAAKASVVSLFLIKTNCDGGVTLEPSVRVNWVDPVAPAAVATVKLLAEFKVKPISLPVVEMVLPLAYVVCNVPPPAPQPIQEATVNAPPDVILYAEEKN